MMNATATANALVNANAAIKNNDKVKMSLLNVSEYRLGQEPSQDCNDTECAICYKRIYNKVFICTEPCGKTFHPGCMEKMIDQIEENADEDKRIEYRCCYCRREFDIQNHDIELFMRHLLGLKAGGYDVNEAIIQAHKNIETLCDDNDTVFDYVIYSSLDMKYVKKPKQAKRAANAFNRQKFMRKNKQHMRRQ